MKTEELQELLAGFQASAPVLDEVEQILASSPVEQDDKMGKGWSKVWSQKEKVGRWRPVPQVLGVFVIARPKDGNSINLSWSISLYLFSGTGVKWREAYQSHHQAAQTPTNAGRDQSAEESCHQHKRMDDAVALHRCRVGPHSSKQHANVDMHSV